MNEYILENFGSIFFILALMWGLYLIDLVSPVRFINYGIFPRKFRGLWGIATSPFIHTSPRHILSNTVALVPLLFIAFMYNRQEAYEAMLIIVVCSGLGSWLFGAPKSVHVGASSIVYGLIGYLLFIGIFKQQILAIVVSLVVLFLHAGSLLSLLIVMPGISWTGHLFGFIGGIVAARLSSLPI